MQVRQINFTTKKQQNQRKINNIEKTQQNIINKEVKSTPAFKGAMDSFCLGLANLIENGGLFVSFTLQDMLGTNLPRPIMGLMRNQKENNGKKNTRFAAKELVREMLTGPSMFLIPMGILAAGKPIFGKTINVPMEQIKALGDIHAASPLNEAGKEITKQEFFRNAFAEIIKNTKGEEALSDATKEKATDFAAKLSKSLSQSKKDKSKTISGIVDDFVTLAKEHATDSAHTDFTMAKLSKKTSAPIKESIGSITAYADDVIGKVKGQDKNTIASAIKKITNKKVLTRLGFNIGMFAAVIAFLRIIPKLYNKAEGQGNSGLTGLMKEQTLNEAPAKKGENVLDAKLNKSNPSFGSSAQTVDKAVNTILNGKGKKFFRGMEFNGFNLSFPLLLSTMALGVLAPRIEQSKDKYDREEILRRDLVTCATMAFGEHELQKGFSKLNESKSGFVLASKDIGFKDKSRWKRFLDYIKPINGVKVMSTEQIVSKYSGIDKYKDGIKGFCDFISGQGGNLGKVFSLTDDAKNLVDGLLQQEGKTIATADNKTITGILDKAKDSAEVKKLTEMFKDKNNPWVKKARTLNARFTALSVLVLVPVFLGFMLPAINERATKKRIKEETAEKLQRQAESLKNISANTYLQDKESQKIFGDFSK